MIQNIVILLVANTLIPLLPFPPEFAAPLPLAHLIFKETTIYEYMNLSRIHTDEQFKRSFRDSIKVLHPDKGGDPQAFAKVKNLKKIMEQRINYYDTLNITDVDLQFNTPFDEIVNMKETTYFVEAGIYYFIVTLYVISFTIDDDLRPARKYLLLITILFGAYEAFMHTHPYVPTVIDYIYDKIPIFMQKTILKSTLSVLIAIIRTKFSRRMTREKQLLQALDEHHSENEYKDIMQGILEIYKDKWSRKLERQESIGSRIKGWISKAFTIYLIFSLVRGFFGGGSSAGEHDL